MNIFQVITYISNNILERNYTLPNFHTIINKEKARKTKDKHEFKILDIRNYTCTGKLVQYL